MKRCCWPSCIDKRYGSLAVCQTHANAVWRYVEDEARVAQQEPIGTDPPRHSLGGHERHGWVYYVDVHGRLKVGFATDVDARLRSYPPGARLLAMKRGTMADEKAEHQRCKPWRVAGREWYDLNDSTLRVVAEARQAERDREREEAASEPLPPRPGT